MTGPQTSQETSRGSSQDGRRAVPRTEVARLLADGKTNLIPGFVSARTGRTFKAFLVLKDDGKVGFEFAPRAEKPAKGAKTAAKKETKEAGAESES